MFKTTRIAIAASAMLLVGIVGGTASANADDTSSEPSSTLQSAPDEFTKYTTSHVYGLPVVDNDASRDTADVMVCRWDIAPGQVPSFGYMSLRDGSLELMVDPDYRKESIDLVYQLCTKTEMGPETAIHINVIRIQEVKLQVLTNRRVKLTNPNPDPVTCYFSQGPRQYASKKVAPGASMIVRVKSGKSDNVCFISSDSTTDAGRGSFRAK